LYVPVVSSSSYKNICIVDLWLGEKNNSWNAAHTIVHSMIVLFRLQNSDRGGLISLLDPFSVFTLLARWCIARDWFGDDLKVLVIIWSTSIESRSLKNAYCSKKNLIVTWSWIPYKFMSERNKVTLANRLSPASSSFA